MKRLAVAVALLLSAVAASAGPERPADGRPPALREVGFEQRLGERVPLELAFRDESGRSVRLGDYFGRRPVVLSLAYFDCPMLCTVSLNGLASALDIVPFEPGRDFEIVTVSFDPKDTPEAAAKKKATYLARYKRPGAATSWHFLTGDLSSIVHLTTAVGFRYAWDEPTKQFAHASGVMVLTPDGRLARYLYGVEYAPKDLRLALVESSAGKIGSAVDELLLYCYRYDPALGRYGAVVMAVVRLFSVLTVLGLAGFILAMRRRERKAA